MSVWQIGTEAASEANGGAVEDRITFGTLRSRHGGQGARGATSAAKSGASQAEYTTGSITPAPAARGDGAGHSAKAAFDNLTKWIPGDVLALYVAAVTAAGAATGSRPSVVLLILFAVLTPVYSLLGGFAQSGKIPASTLLPAVLAAGAFAIWSISVPDSGWQRWSAIHDHAELAAVLAAMGGVLFGFFAQGMTNRKGAANGGATGDSRITFGTRKPGGG